MVSRRGVWTPKVFMDNEKTKVLLGFDYSLNKPAATIMVGDGNTPHFFIWPLSLTAPEIAKYSEIGDLTVHNRNLDSISKGKKSKEKLVESDLTLMHTRRSLDLARMVVDDVREYVRGCGYDMCNVSLYVCSEGYSFASKGNATLDLATYKGVLLSEIYRNFHDCIECFGTYSPISIKSVAGCADKAHRADKLAMIKAFITQVLPSRSEFQEGLRSGELKAKTNYISCVDDIVDSYWAVRTMRVKEGI